MSQTDAALNKLCKWRTFFASWQLGSRPQDDGETRAVKHHREATLILRAEMNALVDLLIKKGVFTTEQFDDAVAREARSLDHELEKSFPGWKSTQEGMSMEMPAALETTRRLGFPK